MGGERWEGDHELGSGNRVCHDSYFSFHLALGVEKVWLCSGIE